MLTTNANFDALHALDYKTPIYLIHFDGKTTDYCNLEPLSPSNTCKRYLSRISGLSQRVEPEEGRSSIGGVTLELLDYEGAITSLLATDSVYFHRKKTVIKAGYLGMTEADMLTIFTGWITGIKLSRDGLSYIFEITDPQKWMQRKVFRSASDSAPVVVSGNWVNIMLAILTSTGAGTNGSYDWYEEPNGLGIDDSALNVDHIESVRDEWFPGNSGYVKFTITERVKAKDFFETEFFKVFNCYPVIDGQGRFDIRAFKPPLAAIETVQSFNEDNIVGLPSWDANLDSMINEIEFFYDYDEADDEFEEQIYYLDAASINARGPGKRSLSIKSKGLHSASQGGISNLAASQVEQRKNKVFERWATPPIMVQFTTFFSQWLSEAGDVVPVSHWLLPNISTGTRGLSETRMEIIERTVDWEKGLVRFTLLNTGFNRGTYSVIAPVMTVTAGASGTEFTVSTADAEKYSLFTLPEVDLYDYRGRIRSSGKTLLTVNTGTGVCTCDDFGLTPGVGDVIRFTSYDGATDQQKLWDWIADSSDKLGSADDDAHLIVP